MKLNNIKCAVSCTCVAVIILGVLPNARVSRVLGMMLYGRKKEDGTFRAGFLDGINWKNHVKLDQCRFWAAESAGCPLAPFGDAPTSFIDNNEALICRPVRVRV
jgi:hypothetical protein